MKKLSKNLFDLTSDQEKTSISMYGKVIKCLIAPYHNILNIPLEANNEVFVYPERDLSIQQRKEIVSVMANSAKNEICFVTSDVFIITDMIDVCCRILTPDGKIEDVKEKTFSANPHTILLDILQDDAHVEKHKNDVKDYRNTINDVITAINKEKMTQAEYDKNKAIIEVIGEDLIRNKLEDMLSDVEIIKELFKKNKFTGVVDFSGTEMEFIKKLDLFKDNLKITNCLIECRKSSKNREEKNEILEQLINLQKGIPKYKDDFNDNVSSKLKFEAELTILHKIEYWLTEQKEDARIKDVLKFKI